MNINKDFAHISAQGIYIRYYPKGEIFDHCPAWIVKDTIDGKKNKVIANAKEFSLQRVLNLFKQSIHQTTILYYDE